MKKIIALALLLSLTAPFAASATEFDEVITPTSNSTGVGAAIDGTEQPINPSTGITQLTETGDTVGCSNEGNFGGSLANALGGGLQQAAGKFLGKFAGQLGPLGGPLMNGLQKVIGGGNIGNLAQQFLGNSAAGSVVSGVAGSALGGGAAGLATGAAGGGASVPVNLMPANQKFLTDTDKTQLNTDRTKKATVAIEVKECISDPLVAKIKNAILSLITKSILDWINGGFDGGPAFVQNLSSFLKSTTDAVITDFVDNQLSGICSPYKQEVQIAVLTQYQYKDNFGKRVQCKQDTGKTEAFITGDWAAGGGWNTWRENFVNCALPGCDLLNSIDEANLQARAKVQQQLIETQSGYKPKVKCTSDSDSNVPEGSVCLDGEIVIPGETVAHVANTTITQGQEQLLSSDEIGEIIDALTSSLTQVIFQGIDGLLGVSKKQSGGGGSYLDNLVGQTGADAFDNTQNLQSGDIQGVLDIEQEYYGIVADAVKHLTDTKKVYTDGIACYQPFVTNPSGTISSATATLQISQASTTLQQVINPQLTSFNQLLADSEDALDQLGILYIESQSALTPEDVLQVNAAYQALLNSGIVHNATDLDFLMSDLETAAAALDALRIDANQKLAECKAI